MYECAADRWQFKFLSKSAEYKEQIKNVISKVKLGTHCTPLFYTISYFAFLLADIYFANVCTDHIYKS